MNDLALKSFLTDLSVVAIIGVSDKPDRASHGVAKWLMQNSHYKIYFVNPLLATLFDQKVYASLTEIPEAIDMVDIFRKLSDIPNILDEAISVGAKSIWLQLGLTDPEIERRAQTAGLSVVMDKCLKIEYARLIN